VHTFVVDVHTAGGAGSADRQASAGRVAEVADTDYADAADSLADGAGADGTSLETAKGDGWAPFLALVASGLVVQLLLSGTCHALILACELLAIVTRA
jgi:hypothetical protein